MTECLTPTSLPRPTSPHEQDFDKYYWDALAEAMKISNGKMKPKHLSNLVLFIMCYRAGLLDTPN